VLYSTLLGSWELRARDRGIEIDRWIDIHDVMIHTDRWERRGRGGAGVKGG